MSIDQTASRGIPPAPPAQVQQAPKVSARERDSDNGAAESKAAKPAESSSPALSLPTDPNKGRHVNISA